MPIRVRGIGSNEVAKPTNVRAPQRPRKDESTERLGRTIGVSVVLGWQIRAAVVNGVSVVEHRQDLVSQVGC